MKRNLRKSISNYLKKSREINHRYNSWHHCFEAFGNASLNEKDLSLNLAFYLASWGMYRGSSQLLQKDYFVHQGAVSIIKANKHLRCNIDQEIRKDGLKELLNLIFELKRHYTEVNVTPTDTLISKILFGALGCLPAFDRYFIEGVRAENLKFKSLNRKSLKELFLFLKIKDEALGKIQEKELSSFGIFYPKMKLIDIYFGNKDLVKTIYKRHTLSLFPSTFSQQKNQKINE